MDANIQISPLQATNGIGEPHTLTGTVNVNNGAGWAKASDGTTINFSVVSGPGSLSLSSCTTSGGAGSCSVTLTSSTAGTTMVKATTDVTVAGVALHRETDGTGLNSGPATKVWVAGSLQWSKVTNSGAPLGGATFQVCRTQDRFGNGITGECMTVLDNNSPDANPVAGQFQLNSLALGRYTVTETIAPAGYVLDPDIVTVDLTISSPSATIGQAFVDNPLLQGKITPTQTTCQDFVSGTASDLTQVFYGVKSGTINNTAPGVFFYYTKVTAPGPAFTINIAQTNNNGAVPFFGVQQNNQVILYNADCSTSNLGSPPNAANGQATISVSGATAGQVFIVSVKYTTSTVVGTTVPNPTTVHYDFKTFIGNAQVDQDPDGLDLMQK